ncbi:hypothetical protein IEQ34_001100 [Dendrobium chrysotoxum]|uniref:Alkaline/neutral invertase n=1 Tax=Dendrobium chrysotoxum TaxID=161865 RepID=A0AAV7HKU7_DENCH|nr:hypothetical protein IEQ34_001100 [Dendrobium chrysotoxum]
MPNKPSVIIICLNCTLYPSLIANVISVASELLLISCLVFVRDFVPSAMAFLMNGESDIVKNFLLKTLQLQSWEKRIDRFKLGEGAMPASFKVLHDSNRKTDTVVADFGESAIGRVAPVDSGFWWIILLRAYTKSTGDISLAESTDCQKGMRLILSLCLSEGFDTFPTLLCADGCSMIDRRMLNSFLVKKRMALMRRHSNSHYVNEPKCSIVIIFKMEGGYRVWLRVDPRDEYACLDDFGKFVSAVLSPSPPPPSLSGKKSSRSSQELLQFLNIWYQSPVEAILRWRKVQEGGGRRSIGRPKYV